MVREFPFTEERHADGSVVRTFADATDDELVWHRDREDRRVVCVEQGGGWMLQMENELPVEMSEGVELFIPKETYHRVVRGAGKLTVKIWKMNS